MSKTLNHYSIYISEWRERKGFVTPTSLDNQLDRDNMLGKLMLVVSEVAEAAEEVRKNNYQAFCEEIADTFIRLFDICGSMGINVGDYIDLKMQDNENRPIRHGKETSL